MDRLKALCGRFLNDEVDRVQAKLSISCSVPQSTLTSSTFSMFLASSFSSASSPRQSTKPPNRLVGAWVWESFLVPWLSKSHRWINEHQEFNVQRKNPTCALWTDSQDLPFGKYRRFLRPHPILSCALIFLKRVFAGLALSSFILSLLAYTISFSYVHSAQCCSRTNFMCTRPFFRYSFSNGFAFSTYNPTTYTLHAYATTST